MKTIGLLLLLAVILTIGILLDPAESHEPDRWGDVATLWIMASAAIIVQTLILVIGAFLE